MKPIVTLTLNPSIDGAAEAEEIHPVRKIRTFNERYDPGGGGINVARVVRELGGEALAVYLAGGITGPLLDRLVETAGISHLSLPIAEDTRISHVVFERSTKKEYRFTPEGPCVREPEWRHCLAALAGLEFDYLVASGSLPRGVPADFYIEVARLVGSKSARFVLDTSGEGLWSALSQGLYLVKPSRGEFESLRGRAYAHDLSLEQAARQLARSGAAELVAVSLGAEGALLATPKGLCRVPAPAVEVRSAVGAGDSFVAAMTLALQRGATAEEAFVYGMAAGTAAVLTPGTELCRRVDVERLQGSLSTCSLA
jgi:6-phosphofructokinase 2